MPEAEAEVLLLLDIEHRNIGGVLDVLDRELSRLSAGEPADTALLQDIAAYFRSFPDACHHPKEDLILERLQAADPALAELLGGLAEEHRNIAEMTRRLAERIENLATAPETGLPAVLAQGGDFVDTYRRHMSEEETRFFPEARRVLTDDDWLAIDFDIFDRPDPVFSESAEKTFSRLRDRIIAEGGAQPGPDEAG